MELFRFGVAQIWSCSDTELLRSGVAQICCCSDLELLRYGVTSGKTLPENESHPERWQRGYKFWSHALTHIKLYLSYPWTRQAHEAIRFIFAKPSWVGVSVAYNQTLLSDSGENFIQTTKEGSQEGQLQNLDIWNIRSQTKKITLQREKSPMQQRRPNTAKNKQNYFWKIKKMKRDELKTVMSWIVLKSTSWGQCGCGHYCGLT